MLLGVAARVRAEEARMGQILHVGLPGQPGRFELVDRPARSGRAELEGLHGGSAHPCLGANAGPEEARPGSLLRGHRVEPGLPGAGPFTTLAGDLRAGYLVRPAEPLRRRARSCSLQTADSFLAQTVRCASCSPARPLNTGTRGRSTVGCCGAAHGGADRDGARGSGRKAGRARWAAGRSLQASSRRSSTRCGLPALGGAADPRAPGI